MIGAMKRPPAGLGPIVVARPAPGAAAAPPALRRLSRRHPRRAAAARGSGCRRRALLAAELGVSRIPVVTAFEQLLAEGYVESRVGAGSFVSPTLPARAAGPAPGRARAGRHGSRRLPPSPLPTDDEPWLALGGAFRVGRPALDALPRPRCGRASSPATRAALGRQLTYGDRHGPPAAARSARRSPAHRPLGRLHGRADHDCQRLAASAGARRAARCWRPATRRGSRSPATAARATRCAWPARASPPVPVDGEGLDVAAGIARARRAARARLRHAVAPISARHDR